MRLFKIITFCVVAAVLIATIFVLSIYDSSHDVWWHLDGIKSFTLLALPSTCAVALLICESHKGWKRLTLIVALVIGTTLTHPITSFLSRPYVSPFTIKEFVLMSPLVFSAVVFLMIGGRRAVLWVKDGFAKSV